MIHVHNIKRDGAPAGEERHIYIGRPMYSRGLGWSPLGNPYRVGPKHYTRAEAVQRFAGLLLWRCERATIGPHGIPADALVAEILRLAALDRTGDVHLYCWCAPEACHGDTIRTLIEQYNAALARPEEIAPGSVFDRLARAEAALSQPIPARSWERRPFADEIPTTTAATPEEEEASGRQAGAAACYAAWVAADQAWQAELVRVYGGGARDARYTQQGIATPELLRLRDATRSAGEAWREATKRRAEEILRARTEEQR